MNLKQYKSQLSVPLQDATLCFLISANEILFAEKLRGFGIGKTNGVGGKRKLGETILETLIRETNEEIRVKLKKFELVGLLYFYFPENPTDINNNQKVHVYLSDEWEGEPQESDEMKPNWYKRDCVPLHKMWGADNLWLPLVLQGKKVNAEFAYGSNDQLIEHQIQLVDNL